MKTSTPTLSSTATNILGALNALARKRRQAACGSFEQLVESIADGKAIAPEQTFEILGAAGKTDGDLVAAVGLAFNRRRWRAAIEAARAAEQRAIKARREIECVERQKADAILPFDEKLVALAEQVDGTIEYVAIMQAADDARRELYRTAPPDLIDKIERAQREKNEVTARVAAAATMLEASRQRLAESISAAARLGQLDSDGNAVPRPHVSTANCVDPNTARTEVVNRRRHIADSEIELRRLRDEESQLAAQLAALEAKRYEP